MSRLYLVGPILARRPAPVPVVPATGVHAVQSWGPWRLESPQGRSQPSRWLMVEQKVSRLTLPDFNLVSCLYENWHHQRNSVSVKSANAVPRAALSCRSPNPVASSDRCWLPLDTTHYPWQCFHVKNALPLVGHPPGSPRGSSLSSGPNLLPIKKIAPGASSGQPPAPYPSVALIWHRFQGARQRQYTHVLSFV